MSVFSKRMRVSPPIFVLSNRDLGSIAEWQVALDDRDFLIRFRLETLNFVPPALSTGFLGDRPIEFIAERCSVSEALGESHADHIGLWTYAYAFDSLGRLEQSLAANMMAIAFATATDGVVFSRHAGARPAGDGPRPDLDGALAVIAGRQELWNSRYPELARQWAENPDGPYDTVVTRVWIGDQVVSESTQYFDEIRRRAAERDSRRDGGSTPGLP
jgi:hypothetical protein